MYNTYASLLGLRKNGAYFVWTITVYMFNIAMVLNSSED